ncbi:MAG: AI-2E family transporter [Erysipelotrichaceae bacterium]|nr:AI-2E family transporter [Erysipelotrichaceae bacterium]MCI9524939.1 AI-2E family transporter [Erysipelotrichaceae bacterium]
MLKRFVKHIDQKIDLRLLAKVTLILLILYLLKLTSSVWGNWISVLKSILTPFVIGFAVAYVMDPLIKLLDRKGIRKNYAILLIFISLVMLCVLFGLVLIPMLYDKISGFIANLIDGVQWISSFIIEYGEFENFDLVETITSNITEFLASYDKWLPNIMNSLPGFMNSFLNVITNTLFTIIIAIYMLIDFDQIKFGIRKFFYMIYPKSGAYLHQIDDDVSVYLKSLLILMLIKFVEYSLFYFLIGHEDWVIIAALTSIGLLIPYLGGTLANTIGILTALSLSPIRIFFLIAGICVLSNVDAYLISPLVHEKRSALGPLTTLLAIFAGGVLYGAVGIMVSVPVAIAIKSICEVYAKDPSHQVDMSKIDDEK